MNASRSRLAFERARTDNTNCAFIGREVGLEGYTGNDADCC